MRTPFFSIVIPTCDRPQLLRYTLKAALSIDYDDYEVVVSDNFSGPETRELIEKADDSRLRYVRTDRRLPMPDNWQYGCDASQGQYVIMLGDDDGIVPSSLDKLEQIIKASGVDLMTWRNFGYYHPDWPSGMRNTVMVGRVTRTLQLIAAEYMLRQACSLDHPGLFEFPHGSRFCFSRTLGETVRARCGRIFDAPYPDFTSSLYMLAVLADSYYAYYDGPVTFTTYSYNSNSAIVLPRKKRNTMRTESFYKEFNEPLYKFTPLKSNLVWNGHAECVLRMHSHFELAPELKAFDYPRYFMICYLGIIEDDLSDVTKTRKELLNEFQMALQEQPEAIRRGFLRLKGRYERYGASILSGRRGLRQIAQNLPRGVKEAVKSSRLVRKASEALLGHTIAAAGKAHGFGNVAELCQVMENVIGGEERFVRR